MLFEPGPMSGMRAARDESQADPFAPGRRRIISCFLLISPSPIRIIFVFHNEFLLCGRELWPCVTASPSLFLRRLSSRRVSSCFFLVSSSAMRVIFVFDDESRTCRMESYSLFTASVFRVCFLILFLADLRRLLSSRRVSSCFRLISSLPS